MVVCLVVEAPKKSGALLTARDAAEHGRDVFCVPGNLDMDTFVGSNALLRDGAIAVASGWEVLQEYAALFPGKITEHRADAHLTAYPEELESPEEEKILLKVAQKPKTPEKKSRRGLFGRKKEIDNAVNILTPDQVRRFLDFIKNYSVFKN